MENTQKTNSYDSLYLQLNLSIQECLERLEAYQQPPPLKINETKRMLIVVTPIKLNEIYDIQINQSGLAKLDARLEAQEDTCVLKGHISYDWSTLIVVWLASGFSLHTDSSLLVICVPFGVYRICFLVYGCQ